MPELTRAASPVPPERAPVRPIAYGPVDIACTPRPDRTLVMHSRRTLEPFDANLARMFRRAVERHPQRLYLAERAPDGSWAGVTYQSARQQVDALAQALIERGLSDARPVMILSGNAVEHALLMELPSYRLPKLRDVVIGLWERGSIFLKRLTGVILALTVVM